MSRILIKLAVALLPPSRKAWGEAMLGEYAHLSAGQTGFAFGCLGSSLKENVTTSEGIARLGFFLVLSFAIIIAGFWLVSWKSILSGEESTEISNLVAIGWWLILGLMPIAIGSAAIQAMKAPIDRHFLANAGMKMVTNLAYVWGGALIFLSMGKLLQCHLTPRCAQVGGVVFLMGYYGVSLSAIAMFTGQNARSLRNLSLIAMTLLVVLIISLMWPSYGVTMRPSTFAIGVLVPTLPLFLMTAAGTLFAWMQRPANQTLQP